MARLSQFGEASGHNREFLVVVGKEIRLFAIEARLVVGTYYDPKHNVIPGRSRMQRTDSVAGL